MATAGTKMIEGKAAVVRATKASASAVGCAGCGLIFEPTEHMLFTYEKSGGTQSCITCETRPDLGSSRLGYYAWLAVSPQSGTPPHARRPRCRQRLNHNPPRVRRRHQASVPRGPDPWPPGPEFESMSLLVWSPGVLQVRAQQQRARHRRPLAVVPAVRMAVNPVGTAGREGVGGEGERGAGERG